MIYYGAAWYLVAWCRLRNDFRHFKLERVRVLEVLLERFPVREGFSLREHLEGNRRLDDKIAVSAWFSPDAIERARRASFNGFVEARPSRGGYEADFMTFSLEWFARWLLSFGAEAEALRPEKLREHVRVEAKAITARHRKQRAAQPGRVLI